MIIARTKIADDLISAIKNGDKVHALKAIGQSSQVFDRVTRSLGDAMAFRLNRSTDTHLDRALIYALAKLARGDTIISKFLERQISKLPISEQSKVAEIASGTRASNSAWRVKSQVNSCRDIFDVAN